MPNGAKELKFTSYRTTAKTIINDCFFSKWDASALIAGNMGSYFRFTISNNTLTFDMAKCIADYSTGAYTDITDLSIDIYYR